MKKPKKNELFNEITESNEDSPEGNEDSAEGNEDSAEGEDPPEGEDSADGQEDSGEGEKGREGGINTKGVFEKLTLFILTVILGGLVLLPIPNSDISITHRFDERDVIFFIENKSNKQYQVFFNMNCDVGSFRFDAYIGSNRRKQVRKRRYREYVGCNSISITKKIEIPK